MRIKPNGATYTAGEGFLTLCTRFLTNLIARNSGGDDFSKIRSRPRALLAEGNVLVLKSSRESDLGTLGMEPSSSLVVAPREGEGRGLASA